MPGLVILGISRVDEDEVEPSETDKLVDSRLRAFISIVKKDQEAAKAICSADNLATELVINAACLDNEEPAALFTCVRVHILDSFKRNLAEAKKEYDGLSMMQSQRFGIPPFEIEQALEELKKIIEDIELILTYMRRYPLIVKHPELPSEKSSEDETGR